MIGSGGSVSDPYQLNTDLFPGTVINTGYTNTLGRTQVSPLIGTDRTCVLILAGQSNISNTAPLGEGVYTPTNPTKLLNLNMFDGGVYQAIDPLLGAGGTGSCMGTKLGDTLITNGLYDRVILVPLGIGSTTVANWTTTGVCNHRIGVAARRIAAVGLTPTYVLWQQGESDKAAGTAPADYTTSLNNVISTFRANGVTCPLFIAVATHISGTNSIPLQNAQIACVNNITTFLGANTDTLDDSFRDSLVDFTYAGMTSVAALWTTVLTNFKSTHG